MGIKFRSSITYSTDAVVSIGKGRIKVVPNVEHRVKVVLTAIKSLTTKWKRSVFLFEITQRVQQIHPTYTYQDIVYVLRKCVRTGMVTNLVHGMYGLSKENG